jgi:SnoaL-like domain
MSAADVRAADELEALRQLKARYCRFLDTKQVESWRNVFTTDVVVTLDLAVSTGGADPMTTPPVQGIEVRDNFVPMVMGGLANVATMHLPIQESRTPSSASPRPPLQPGFGRWKTGSFSPTAASYTAPVTTTRRT